MKYNRVIYIRYIPLTVKIHEDFYLQQVADIGIDVEYWDVSRLFFKTNTDLEDSSYLCTTLYFDSYQQLEERIIRINKSKTLFISIMTLNGEQRKLYRLFTKHNCALGIFGRNVFPQGSFVAIPLFKRLLSITPAKLMNLINKKRLMKEMTEGTIKGYNVIFLGGNNGWQGIGNIAYEQVLNTRNVKMNSNDYDNYLKLREDKNRLVEGRYILFLDEYLPLHPDVELLHLSGISPEEYYPQLNAYFDRVEEQFGVPLIIAAHPKALRYKREDFFNGRPVFFGKSAVLSKDADFVIAHDSTSINYPIAFRKKLHFITSSNIARRMQSVNQNVLNFAKYLGCNVQYFDSSDKVINLVERIDEVRYEAYKYDFQTSIETEDILSENIFVNYLKE